MPDIIGDWQRELPLEAVATLQVIAMDIDRAWTLMMSPEGFRMHGEQWGESDATLHATASALYQALWGRGVADVDVTGDASVLDAWLASVRPAWSTDRLIHG